MKLQTAHTTAQLLILNLFRFSEEKNKEISRCRFSKATLKRIAGRKKLRESFLMDLSDELFSLNWHFIEHSDTEFAIIQVGKIDVWTKIASSRINDLRQASAEEVQDEFDMVIPLEDLNDE
jgi:hypothetical protein